MSLRRAAIRREQKQREKAMKSRSPDGELARAKEQGKIDGRTLSVFISAIYLHRDFGWGAKRVINLIEKGNAEAVRFDNDGVEFALEFYAKKIGNKLNDLDLHKIRKVKTLVEKVYYDNRNDYFITGMSVVSTVLSSEYSMSLNNRGTGRLDKLIDNVTKEYLNVLNGTANIEMYQERILEEIGINFKEG